MMDLCQNSMQRKHTPVQLAADLAPTAEVNTTIDDPKYYIMPMK